MKVYNAKRAYVNLLEKAETGDPAKDLYPVAFSELVSFIMGTKLANIEPSLVVFRMAEI